MQASVVLVLSLAAVCIAGPAQLLPKQFPDGRIVGGVETTIQDLPHQLSLMYYGSHICGATIISADWAVTASHCVDGRSASSISLRSGSTAVNSGGTVHPASQIIMHEKYNPSTIDWDIAVIRVSKKFVFSSSSQPIQMRPSGNKVPTNTPVIVSGWGTTSSGGSAPKNLRKVTVNVVDHNKCDDAYWQYGGVTDRMMCAGVPEGGKDSCQGDSGGPLITNNPRVLVGVVSWGAGCASRGYPGVYADVSVLRDWVKSKTGV